MDEHSKSLNGHSISDDMDSHKIATKMILLEQQKCLETIKRKDLANSIIISALPNYPLAISEDNEPSSDNSSTHSVKLQFEVKSNLTKLIKIAKKLKFFKHAKIFINHDEPHHTKKENLRLRTHYLLFVLSARQNS